MLSFQRLFDTMIECWRKGFRAPIPSTHSVHMDLYRSRNSVSSHGNNIKTCILLSLPRYPKGEAELRVSITALHLPANILLQVHRIVNTINSRRQGVQPAGLRPPYRVPVLIQPSFHNRQAHSANRGTKQPLTARTPSKVNRTPRLHILGPTR